MAELIKEGVPVERLYVVHTAPSLEPNPFIAQQRRYLGRIESIRDGKAILSDSVFREYDLEKCHLEGTRTNVEAVGTALLGKHYENFSNSLLVETYKVMGAEHQLRRINQLGDWLNRKSPLRCNEDLSIRVHRQPRRCYSGKRAGESRRFYLPRCVLRPGGTITVDWPVDPQIDKYGPYDAETFPDKRVQIAVISPQTFLREIKQFMLQFRDGFSSDHSKNPFGQGFVRKYHLNSCDFVFQEVPPHSSDSSAESYKKATLELLNKVHPNLAIVVIRDRHRDLIDKDNPYYTTKASLMAQGVPAQMLRTTTVRRENRGYILNNLALASYAKLGGIPWTLTSNQDLDHEIVVGIGSARLVNRRSERDERIIGITTVFSGDGQYLLANSTREVSSNEYLKALIASLSKTVSYLRSRYGWKSGDRVRFIFHQSFKRYKNIEACAVRRFTESLSDLRVSYAFVHITKAHNWMLFDPSVTGIRRGNKTTGLMVPRRAQTVPLGPHTALLTLSGPYQVRTALQGCPHPVLINIHEKSTFKSLEYITRQAFDLSFMSWRGFSPSRLPVSIEYSNMIVDLLAHLRSLKNWNPETLSTALKERRWFL